MSFLYDILGIEKDVEEFVDNSTTRVYIPSFVVRISVKKTYYHFDWPLEGGSNGLTFMAPLYDMSDQDEGCNLLYKDEEGKAHVYKYTFGKGVVFGGGLSHSSQPCVPRSTKEIKRPWAFLCFNFGTTRMEYWDTLLRNIACSGRWVHVYYFLETLYFFCQFSHFISYIHTYIQGCCSTRWYS